MQRKMQRKRQRKRQKKRQRKRFAVDPLAIFNIILLIIITQLMI